jgi:hypothetical protein
MNDQQSLPQDGVAMENSTADLPASIALDVLFQALYSALLRREITAEELQNRLAATNELDKTKLVLLIRNILSSPEFALNFDNFIAEQPLLRRNSIGHISAKMRSVAIVAVYDEVWLAFCLAIADYLYDEFSLQTLLVTYTPFQRAYDAELLSPAVVGSIRIADLLKLADNFQPEFLVVHSFGFAPQTTELLQRFHYAPLLVYGDAYKNTVSDKYDNDRPIAQSLMFGFNDGSANRGKLKAISSKVIPSRSVLHYRRKLANYYPFAAANVNAEPAKYSIFYLRYWGIGAYGQLSDDEIIQCWVDTVRNRIVPGTVLIIKNDPRVKPGMYQLFLQQLNVNNINTLDFNDYLTLVGLKQEQMGMLPVEYFFIQGLLCRADRHFVLDSSLAYSLAVEPNIQRPCQIYIGPDAAAFSLLNCPNAKANIKYGVELYSKGLLESSETGAIRELTAPHEWPRCFELCEEA